MRPLTEEEILTLVREQDKKNGVITPQMTDTQFLLELYAIAPLGQGFVTTDNMAKILNIRVAREGLEKRLPYDAYSVRQKVFMGKHRTRSMWDEYNDPNGTAVLYPLDEEEEKYVFGSTIGNQHFFLVRDALMVRLTRHSSFLSKEGKKREKDQEKKKRGRPPKPGNELKEKRRSLRGRPPKKKGRILRIAQEIKEYQEKHDTDGILSALQKMERTIAENTTTS
jgi:hypothetical protein